MTLCVTNISDESNLFGSCKLSGRSWADMFTWDSESLVEFVDGKSGLLSVDDCFFVVGFTSSVVGQSLALIWLSLSSSCLHFRSIVWRRSAGDGCSAIVALEFSWNGNFSSSGVLWFWLTELSFWFVWFCCKLLVATLLITGGDWDDVISRWKSDKRDGIFFVRRSQLRPSDVYSGIFKYENQMNYLK